MKNLRFPPIPRVAGDRYGGRAAVPACATPPRRTPAALSRVACVAALAIGVAGPAFAAGDNNRNAGAKANTTQGTPAMKAYRGLRASEVIGMSVRNPQGNNIGQISDMIVNLNTGEVQYAVLQFDPGIFQGEKLYAVPTTELRMAADRNDVVYDMSRERLERASVERSDWDNRSRDQGFFASLDRFWGRTQAQSSANAYRASDLIGKDVKSRSGEDIGEIEELVIDMANQRVHYAVMEFDPSWTTPGRNYAFPMRSFELAADREDLVLDVNKSLVQSMKSFTDDRYSQLSDPAWTSEVDRTLVVIAQPVSRGTGSTSGADSGSTGPYSGGSGSSAGMANRSDGTVSGNAGTTDSARMSGDAAGAAGARSLAETANGRGQRFDGVTDTRAPRRDRN